MFSDRERDLLLLLILVLVAVNFLFHIGVFDFHVL